MPKQAQNIAAAARFRALITPLGVAMLLGVGVSSCAVGPRYKRPTAPAPATYDETALWTTAAPNDDFDRGEWWKMFNDPVLDELEQRVNVSNQNIAAADAAYRQATALVREARAAYLPAVDLNVGATRSHSGARSGVSVGTGSTTGTGTGAGTGTGTGTGGAGSGTTTTTTTTTTASGTTGTIYQAGLGASWEPDVWGRLRRTTENARANAAASAADLVAARLSAQALLATAYFQLRETDVEHELVKTTVEAYRRSLEITQNRYNAKIVAKIDVLQSQSQLATTQSQLAALEQQRATLEHAIAVQVGEAPGAFHLAAAEWVATVPDVPLGIPSTLLQRRPDIATAERLVAAANAEIGFEETGYFPNFELTASYGSASSTLSDLFSAPTRIWSLGATAAQTLFDAGLTRARVAAARASYDQAVANYRQTVLTSFQGVEDQLAATLVLKREYEFLQQAAEAANAAEVITLNEYKAGQIVYTDVVVAQAAALTARRSFVQSAVTRQTTAISLIQALGGGWTAPQQE